MCLFQLGDRVMLDPSPGPAFEAFREAIRLGLAFRGRSKAPGVVGGFFLVF